MNKIAVATIFHPPCLQYLKEHLHAIAASLEAAQAFDTRISLVGSQITTAEQIEFVKNVIRETPWENIELQVTPERLNIAQARNAAVAPLINDAEWIVCTDSDTVMNPDYAQNLLHYLDTMDLKDTLGLCGIPGVWKKSDIGDIIGMAELAFLAIRVRGGSGAMISALKQYKPEDIEGLIEQMPEKLSALAGQSCTNLQGYNCVIHSSVMRQGGFDTDCHTAEDREMAAFITKCLNKKIKFIPGCQIRHCFDMDMEHAMRRGETHGVWCRRIYDTYNPDKPSPSLDATGVPVFKLPLFSSETAQAYLRNSSAAFSRGWTKNDGLYVDHRAKIGVQDAAPEAGLRLE